MLTPHGWLEVRENDGPADCRRVAVILCQSYPQEAWTGHDVSRFADRAGNAVKVLTLDDGRVIGALLYRVTADAVRIARVAVDRRFRRCRVGAFALRVLTGPTSYARRGLYEVRVNETNTAGIALMQMSGFSPAGVTREYFRDGRDAYVFRLVKEVPHRKAACAVSARS